MTRSRRWPRLCLWGAWLSTLVPLTACQVTPGQAGGANATLPTLADAAQSFVVDFARQVLQAAIL